MIFGEACARDGESENFGGAIWDLVFLVINDDFRVSLSCDREYPRFGRFGDETFFIFKGGLLFDSSFNGSAMKLEAVPRCVYNLMAVVSVVGKVAVQIFANR